MDVELKRQLIDRMMEVGAYDVKIADPRQGFEYVTELERHPLSLMPECQSVITFVIPRSRLLDLWYIGHRRSNPQEPDYWTERQVSEEEAPFFVVYRLFTLITSFVMLKAIAFLHRRGYHAIEKHEKEDWPLPLAKLCAYEAGLGVYGKSGLILHPELGNRIGIGVVLTDAELPPDRKLDDFHPCTGCNLCVESCPAGAFGPTGEYHHNWSEERCLSTRDALKQKGAYCNICWEVCPYGTYMDNDLFFMNIQKKKYVRELQEWAENRLRDIDKCRRRS
jgi:ferredoxin